MAGGDDHTLRQQLIDTCLKMNALGINQGRSGNASLRLPDPMGGGMLITPSGMAYEDLTPDDMVQLTLAGEVLKGHRKPSSEWHFHGRILETHPDAGAVVHTHSVHATALSCHGLGIPPFHYMVAMAGGRDIRCTPYATFGTEELAGHVIRALAGRRACLMGNHGLIALGADLPSALDLAVEVETLAQQYLAARTLGEPTLLSDGEMDRVLDKFRTYGANAQRT